MITGQPTALSKQTRLQKFAAKAAGAAIRIGLPAQRFLRRLLISFTKPIAALIGGIKDRMLPFTRTLEQRFLDCGEELDSLTRHTEAMVACGGELIHLATGRDEAEQIITETMTVLEGPLGYLERCTTAMQAQIDTLSGCSEAITRLLECQSRMQGVVAPLKVTQTMFRVEASRLPEEARGSFASLTDQIEVLHAQVRDSFSGQFQTLRGARQTLENVTMRLETGVRTQRQILEQKRTHIEGTLDTLTAEIRRNSGRDIALWAKSKAVSGAVGRVVVALQSQDIVSQRIAHILEGLASAAAKGEELETLPPDESGVAEVAGMRVLVEIQASQWAGVHAEIESSVSAVTGATSEILSTIDSLENECVFLNEFSEVTAAANGTIQVLLEIVEEVKVLVRAAVSLAEDSRELIRPVEAVTGQLTGSVELLSHQMNLVALNAQIQAVQIGAGTGLEVLAAHTASIAAEITTLGTSISADLDQLRERLRHEMNAFLEFCDSGRSVMDFLATSGSEHEQKLHAIRDTTLSTLHLVGESVNEVRKSSHRIHDHVEVSRGDLAKLDWLGERLAGIADELRESVPAVMEGPATVEFDENSYTMASERVSHRAVVDRLSDSGAATTESTASAGGEIELF